VNQVMMVVKYNIRSCNLQVRIFEILSFVMMITPKNLNRISSNLMKPRLMLMLLDPINALLSISDQLMDILLLLEIHRGTCTRVVLVWRRLSQW